MSSKIKKKAKSVERTKHTIKQDAPQHTNNNNNNNNNQVVQIIFPSDVEIRKKKKKRGTSSAARKKKKEKDELLTLLKQKLQEYDALHAQLQQANIKVPAELGIAVISHGQLKTNEEIQAYINDVQNKIAKLQELLQQQSAPAGLPMRLGAGVMQLANLPALPASAPLQPSYMQPFQRMPTQSTTASTVPTTPAVDPIQQRLQQIAKDVQDHLKEKGTDQIPAPPSGLAPTTPAAQPAQTEPIIPAPPIPKTGPGAELANAEFFETITGLKVGKKRMSVVAPKGWVDYYDRYRKFLEDVQYDTIRNQLTPGVFHIKLEQANNLLDSKNAIYKDYLTWHGALQPAVLNAIATLSPLSVVRELDQQIKTNLSMDLPGLATQILKAENIPVKEVTMGDTDPAIVARIQKGGKKPFTKSEDNEAYQKYQDEHTEVTDELTKMKKRILKGDLTESDVQALDKKINVLETKIFNTYQGLPPNVKLAVTVNNDEMTARFNELREKLAKENAMKQPRIIIMNKSKAEKTIKEYLQQKERNKDPPAYSNDVRSAVIALFGNAYEKTLQSKSLQEKADSILEKMGQYNTGSGDMVQAMLTIDEYTDKYVEDEKPKYTKAVQSAVLLMFGKEFEESISKKKANEKAEEIFRKFTAWKNQPKK